MSADWKEMSAFSYELKHAAALRKGGPKWVISPPIYSVEGDERILTITVAWRDGDYGHYKRVRAVMPIEPLFAVLQKHWEICKPHFEENE